MIVTAGGEVWAIDGPDTTLSKRPDRLICISFDELPASQTFTEIDRRMVCDVILEALKEHDVKAIGFVVGDYVKGDFDILGQWLNAGHLLGNMTGANSDLHEVGFENFIDDIITGHQMLEPMLSGFGQRERYFRYPFLHYGQNLETKRQVTGFLASQGVISIPATVVVEDYLYNLSLEKLGEEVDSASYYAIMEEYLNHVMDQLEEAEALSQEVLHRPCRHILQLRANRLNSAFCDELLTALQAAGYRFVSIDEALEDEVYGAPEGYSGARGVGWLHMIRYSDPNLLPAE
jgi:peptidoglycan/xylan/chitin deacetylase (PgdA/CDA1 family)